jgi:DNA primase large subunit
MYLMYKRFHAFHKLKHNGRLQLGLFLKGIGLNMNDSLEFWRRELSKLVGADGFEKQYAYNVKYNYGHVGAARHTSPYSCIGMVKSPPTSGINEEVHGCPFHHLTHDDAILKLLREMTNNAFTTGVRPPGLDEQLNAFVQRGH